MTRVLSDLLGAAEPYFSHRVQQLESLAGHPRADIYLSAEIQQQCGAKLRELGLDDRNTTGQELYEALGSRLRSDEIRFKTAIHSGTAGDDQMTDVARVLRQVIAGRTSFALKSVVAKKLLKVNLPRKTMKTLGYRSVDSMLKHETAASLLAAAWLIESLAWRSKIVAAYAKLQVSDFEVRPITIEYPIAKRWNSLSDKVVAVKKCNIVSFKELGTVVLLPLPTHKPPLVSLTTTVLTLHAINGIIAAGTYLKLQQLQAGFGTSVQQVVLGEPLLPTESLDEPVSWHSLHQYFARFQHLARRDVFEPLVAAEELTWLSVERVIADIDPSFEFWVHSAHLGILSLGRATSFNMTDALLSHCNGLRFEQRLTQYFKQSLQTELLLRYLSQDRLQQTIFGNLQLKLAPQMALL